MQKKKSNHWRVIPVLVLLFAVFGTTCELEGTLGKDDDVPIRVADIINAKLPIITTQPAVGLALLTTTSTVTPLTVTANAQETDGVLSFEWLQYTDPADYENSAGTLVGVGTSTGTTAITSSFTPSIDEEGVFYYYVKVTNTLARATGVPTATVKSEPSIVTVSDPNNAEFPSITAVSGAGYYTAPASFTLGVTATATAGSLSYKWFTATEAATTNGTEIPSQTNATLAQSGKAAGAYYYYLEVNNNDAGKSGRKDSKVVVSFIVTVISANATLTVNTAVPYQFIRGFGGMYTPWDNTPQEYVADFERMYSPDGLGLNILRIMILPTNTDIDQTMYDITTGRDGDGKDQSIYYDIVKVVNKYNGYVLASPWSPPAAWKSNGDIVGNGTLLVNRYKAFANYLRDFCINMRDHGAPIYAVSMQNEPTFKASYAGCEYDTAEHREWWIAAGNFTATVPGWGGGEAISRVLTMTGEAHNSVTPFHDDSTSALQTPASRQYIDIVGVHNYGRGINVLADGLRHGKEVWMTEHNINSGEGSFHQDSTWNYVWKLMNDIDLTIRLNQENAFVWWTAKRFYSFIGDGTNGTVDGHVMHRGYGISHYAKFANEMTRVAVTGSGTTGSGGAVASSINLVPSGSWTEDSTDPKITAYKSADGTTISLVMYTPTDSSGGGGVNMGTVKIQLPAGFKANWATAMRSNAAARGITENVTICADRNSAIVTLPVSTMLSVKFTGVQE